MRGSTLLRESEHTHAHFWEEPNGFCKQTSAKKSEMTNWQPVWQQQQKKSKNCLDLLNPIVLVCMCASRRCQRKQKCCKNNRIELAKPSRQRDDTRFNPRQQGKPLSATTQTFAVLFRERERKKKQGQGQVVARGGGKMASFLSSSRVVFFSGEVGG